MRKLRTFFSKTALILSRGLFLFIVHSVAPQSFAASQPNTDSYFPKNTYPKIEDVSDSQSSSASANEGLYSEIQGLKKQIQKGVKKVAKRRNMTCFGDPCILQGFPLLYSFPESGFFGGAQANLTNISNIDPYTYTANLRLVRSDTGQWLIQSNIDIPELNILGFKPRLKLRGSLFRSTEFQYAGEGLRSKTLSQDDYSRLRYSLEDVRGGFTLLIPINLYKHAKFGMYASYDYATLSTENYSSRGSVLYDEKPFGYEGGTFRVLGLGIYYDARNREVLTRSGEMLEWGLAVGVEEDTMDRSYRMTLIDRRYFSEGRWTLAQRLTLDGVFGSTPFYQLSSVGGVDPIRDVSSSGILKGYPGGRFHEKIKIMESAELRLHQNDFKAFGQRGELALMLAAVDIALMNELFAWSFSTGVDMFWNKSFLTRLYFSYGQSNWAIRLRFLQQF